MASNERGMDADIAALPRDAARMLPFEQRTELQLL